MGTPRAGDLSALALSSAPDWTITGPHFIAQLGSAVGAGDFDGDGYSDVLIGAERAADVEDNEGMVFLFSGSADGLPAVADWVGQPDNSSSWYGNAVSSADVNGDGYDDVIVASIFLGDNFDFQIGGAFAYHGSASGPSASADWTVTGDHYEGMLGSDVRSAGDVNGDGYDDVVIGQWYYDGAYTSEGSAQLHFGSASGLSALADWRVFGGEEQAYLGRAVAGAGDVNGDGFDDVVVGAHWASVGGLDDAGRLYLYYGSPTGPSTVADWTADGATAKAWLGSSVAPAGDVNGDGYADFIASAPGYDDAAPGKGAVYVYLGSPTGPAATPDWTVAGALDDAGFGNAVAGAGDVNGDGYDDVLYGSYTYSNGQTSEGAVFLHLGSPDGPALTASWSAESNQTDSPWFGWAVGSAGDIDADGFDDVLVGAKLNDVPFLWSGAAYLYRGGCDVTGDDSDSDGLPDDCDACDLGANVDGDRDGVYDACDPCPSDAGDDSDGDGVCDSDDLCPASDDGLDRDADGAPDGCDPCPDDAPDDSDGDGVCDGVDACPGWEDGADADGDGVADGCDACDLGPNQDADGDGQSDACDPCPADALDDSDGDGVCDGVDACPGADDGADGDGDGAADGCDPCPADAPDDTDGDGVCDGADACPGSDDGADADGDAVADGCDPCPSVPGDVCDAPEPPKTDPEVDAASCGCDHAGAGGAWVPGALAAAWRRRRARPRA